MPTFSFTVTRTKKFSGISIQIHPERGVIVKAPFWLPDVAIRKFVEDKSEWVEKHLSRIRKNAAPQKSYTPGETHLFFGIEYPLDITHHEVPLRTQAVLDEVKISVKIYRGHEGEKRVSEIRDALLRLYLEQGIAKLTEKVNHYCTQIGVDYSRIVIKQVSSIWGSCSPSNVLCFNRKLIMAPHPIVDYVVIHEVCHLVHRNHSSRFWGLVYKFDPQYKEHRRWLHQNHYLLTI